MGRYLAFTFMEMLVTLFIIGLLSLLVLPDLQTLLNSTHDRLLLAQLIHAMELARQETNASHLPVALQINDRKLFLFFNPQRNGEMNKETRILLQETLHLKRGHLHLRLFPQYQKGVLFLPHGAMANDNATFWYCAQQDTRARWAIMLSKSGRMRTMTIEDGIIVDSHGQVLLCN